MTTQRRPGSLFGRLTGGLSGREWRWNGWLIGAALCLLVIASGTYNIIKFRVTGDVPWGNSAADMEGSTYLTGLAVWIVAAAVTAYIGISRLPRRRESGVLAPADRERFQAALLRAATGQVPPQPAGRATPPHSPSPPTVRLPKASGAGRQQDPLTEQTIEAALARVLEHQESKNRRREIVLLVIGTAVGLFGPMVLGHLPGLAGG
ncbi:MAG: hypothetical protein M3O55_04280 [Actinomycetota bacterium]|nr:hypothetical protein [Actinomycetota bacterium]